MYLTFSPGKKSIFFIFLIEIILQEKEEINHSNIANEILYIYQRISEYKN